MIETNVELPEGAVVDAVVEVVGYIDKDGDWAWAARWEGGRVATVLGLLDLGENAILREQDARED